VWQWNDKNTMHIFTSTGKKCPRERVKNLTTNSQGTKRGTMNSAAYPSTDTVNLSVVVGELVQRSYNELCQLVHRYEPLLPFHFVPNL
ncbi:hypothetical protein M1146_06260, partial [Patescibacteria group bacterium]|nr:hypothetical protein [Patescibacteria group bacterium]